MRELGYKILNIKPTLKSCTKCREDSSRSALTCLEVLGGKREIWMIDRVVLLPTGPMHNTLYRCAGIQIYV